MVDIKADIDPVATIPTKSHTPNTERNQDGQRIASKIKKLIERYAAAAFGFTYVPIARLSPWEERTLPSSGEA